MKQLVPLFLLLTSLNFCHAQEPFNDCAAVFLNSDLLVDDYSPRGKSSLSLDATGTISVKLVTFGEGEKPTTKAGEGLPFHIAIQDKKTQTILLYSEKPSTSLDIQQVLKRCHSGDKVLVMVTDDRYAVPHGEITIN